MSDVKGQQACALPQVHITSQKGSARLATAVCRTATLEAPTQTHEDQVCRLIRLCQHLERHGFSLCAADSQDMR